MNRRELLRTLAASAAVVGCTGKGGDTAAELCSDETPAQGAGPFYVAVGETGADITEGKAGIPLLLTLWVVEVDSCAPIAGATVEIWHADAEGTYSGFEEEGTAGETFLRGLLTTDEGGQCRFDTIIPGFYEGRTLHIHVRIAADGYPELTTQLYFPKDVILAVAPEYPAVDEYTTNLEDGGYEAGNELAMSGDTGGFTGEFVVGVKR